MTTIGELWLAGHRLVRRDPWAPGNYMEIQPFPLDPTKYHIIALLHSPLEWAGAPEDVKLPAQSVPLWMMPPDGWEEYTGKTVEEGRMQIVTDEHGRRWLERDSLEC